MPLSARGYFIGEACLTTIDVAFLCCVRAPRLWQRCAVVLCADGAANRLLALDSGEDWLPTAIVGDLDSIEDSSRKHYR